MRLPFTVTLAALLAVAAAPLPGRARQGAAARTEPPAAKRTARLHGVGLTYDAALAAEVKVEVAPSFGCGKPGDVVPKHVAFTFDGYPRPHPEPFMRPPEVMVFPVAEYRRVLAACDREMAATLVASSGPLNYVSDFDDQVRTLKALNAARPSPRALNTWLRRGRSRRHHRGRMPLVPMYDVGEALRAKVSYLDFRGGRGVAFVAQFTIEDTIVSNQALAYVFQGLTDDGRFYVSAAFPVAAPFLPAEYTEAEALEAR